MTWTTIAPTVAAPSAAALAAGALAMLLPRSARGTLAAAVEGLFPGAGVVDYATGRAALAEALRVAMRATGRRRVVLPAYTSYSVAAAAISAGATVDLCDLDSAYWDLDREALRRLVGPDTAAVVLGNLFGTPDRTADLGWLAEAGVVLVDDAAQALGAREHGRSVGGRGALGVLSFGRGKCVTLGDGGALLVGDPALAGHVQSPPPGGAGLKPWLMAAAMTACVEPWLFGAVSRVPGAGIGESHFDPGFPSAGAPASAGGLASDLPAAIARQLAIRRRVAGWWDEALGETPEIHRPLAAPGTEPAFLRVPVLAEGAAAKQRLLGALAQLSFRYVQSFPGPLGGLPALRAGSAADTPVAEQVAAHLVALPCHAGVNRWAIERAAPLVRAHAARRSGR